MIFSRTKVAICFIIAFILQPILEALLGLTNCGPNLILCVASFLLVLYYDSPFLWGMALLSSIGYDIMYSSTLGFSTVAIVVSMLCVLVVRYFFYLDNILIVPILAGIDSIVFNLVEWLISHAQGSIYSFTYVLKYSALDLIGNGIALFIIYLLLRKYLVKHRSDSRLY